MSIILIEIKDKKITVRSENGPASTIIDGKGNGSVVRFRHAEITDSVLEGFTIKNGWASHGGGIYCASSPRIINCNIRGNMAYNGGGGIYCYYASPIITNCMISDNYASKVAAGFFARTPPHPGFSTALSAAIGLVMAAESVAHTPHLQLPTVLSPVMRLMKVAGGYIAGEALRWLLSTASEISVKVRFRAEGEVQMASAHVDEGKSVQLQLSEDGRSASCKIPIADMASGDHKLSVQYQLAGKEMEKKGFAFSLKCHDRNLLQMKPEGNVFDHQSPIMVYYTPQIKEEVESVRLLVDGTDVTIKALAYTDGVMYFPLETFEKGEHFFRCEVTLSDGRVIAQEQQFTVMSMDD